jgi:hypothetical protein
MGYETNDPPTRAAYAEDSDLLDGQDSSEFSTPSSTQSAGVDGGYRAEQSKNQDTSADGVGTTSVTDGSTGTDDTEQVNGVIISNDESDDWDIIEVQAGWTAASGGGYTTVWTGTVSPGGSVEIAHSEGYVSSYRLIWEQTRDFTGTSNLAWSQTPHLRAVPSHNHPI